MVIIPPRIWREGRATDSKRTSVWSTYSIGLCGNEGWNGLAIFDPFDSPHHTERITPFEYVGCWGLLPVIELEDDVPSADVCWSRSLPMISKKISWCGLLPHDWWSDPRSIPSFVECQVIMLWQWKSPSQLDNYPIKTICIRMHTVHHTGIHHCPDNLRYRQRRSLCRRHLHRPFCFWWNVGMVGHN